jgi:predicted RNA-binding protein with TRAM domain
VLSHFKQDPGARARAVGPGCSRDLRGLAAGQHVRAELCERGGPGAGTAAGAGAVVLTTEALSGDRIQVLVQVVERQPVWSALPLIVLTGGGASTQTSLRQLRRLEPLKEELR